MINSRPLKPLAYRFVFGAVQISPGKNAIFLSNYLLHLLPFAFGSKDFDLLCSLIQRTLALNEVRVPQTGSYTHVLEPLRFQHCSI